MVRGTRRTSTEIPDSTWLGNSENVKNMTFFLEGYEGLVLLADEYLLEDTSQKKRHVLNKEYIRFRPRVVGLYDKTVGEDACPIKLEQYCLPPVDLLMNDSFFTEGGGFKKMTDAYGEIKWRFEGAGLAITHAPADFQEHLKETDCVLSNSTRDPEPQKTPLTGKTISFNRGQSTIVADGESCNIDRASIQSRIIQTMFSRGSVVGRSVHWRDILGVPLSDTASGREVQNQSVRGAVRGINENVQRTFNTDDELFGWNGRGSLVRNF